METITAERCDGCGARAQYTILTPSGVLTLCAHHTQANRLKFRDLGYVVEPITQGALS